MPAKVYLPTAATGNSLGLATFGPAAEIMGFFYPRLDFARNVREGMFGLRLSGASSPSFIWCFDEGFERRQSFLSDTDILVTRLRHDELDLTLELTDLLPPGERALVRRIVIERGPRSPEVTFLHYFRLAVADTADRNAAYYFPGPAAVVQHFQQISLAVALSVPFAFQLGSVSGEQPSSTKQAMLTGRLEGPWQIMGHPDFAVAADTAPKARFEALLVLAGATGPHEAARDARRLAAMPFEDHCQQVQARGRGLFHRVTPCHDKALTAAYHLAVLTLNDLYDQDHGAYLAAPEFDPGYTHSGGYGYCWPRDSAVCALTASKIGLHDQAEAFFDWAIRTQLDDGHWFQRYWLDGSPAPSWCVQDAELQLDQTCALLHAAAMLADGLGDRRDAFVNRFRQSAMRAADAIIRHLGDDGLHKPSADLWECCYGAFAYTQAAVIAALGEGRRVFATASVDLDRLRTALLDKLWDAKQGRWARRITPEGDLDTTMDSSCLGLIEPWCVLDLRQRDDFGLAERTLDGVAQRLMVDVPGGRGVLRFENEHYMGGGAGCVNTLWYALCRLRLAGACPDSDKERHTKLADDSIRVALANTNPVGQFPELIPKRDFPYWAAPHAWASSLFIECMLARRELANVKAPA